MQGAKPYASICLHICCSMCCVFIWSASYHCMLIEIPSPLSHRTRIGLFRLKHRLEWLDSIQIEDFFHDLYQQTLGHLDTLVMYIILFISRPLFSLKTVCIYLTCIDLSYFIHVSLHTHIIYIYTHLVFLMHIFSRRLVSTSRRWARCWLSSRPPRCRPKSWRRRYRGASGDWSRHVDFIGDWSHVG